MPLRYPGNSMGLLTLFFVLAFIFINTVVFGRISILGMMTNLSFLEQYFPFCLAGATDSRGSVSPAQKRRKMVFKSTLALWVFLCLVAVGAQAASPAHNSVVLLLDKSGSMKKSDPDCIRWDAVDLLLHLMKNEDRVSVYSFGTDVKSLSGDMVTLDQTIRDSIANEKSRCVAKDQFTYILADHQAAENSLADQGAAHRQAYIPTIVILTDGVDDVKAPASDRLAQMDAVLKSISGLNGRIHGIGLSAGADRELLGRIRDITNGESIFLTQAHDLLGSFFGLSREIGDRWLLWEGRTNGDPVQVELPAWVEEITAVFVPDKPVTAQVFSSESKPADLAHSRYQVIKVDKAGRGMIVLDTKGRPGKIIVDASGDLVLHAGVPEVVPAGVPFDVEIKVFAGRDQELGPAAFLNELAADLTWKDALDHSQEVFLYDDGTHNDGQAKDGVFGGRSLIRTPGTAIFKARVKAPFSRPLLADGPVRVLGEPLRVAPPVGGGPLGMGSSGDVTWTVENLTGVRIPGRAIFKLNEDVVESRNIVVPPDGSVEIKKTFPQSLTRSQDRRAEIYLGEGESPVAISEKTVWPLGWLLLVGLVVVLVVLAGFFVPRRSLHGTSMTVMHYGSEDDDPETQTVQFSRDGSNVVLDLPQPFNNPGSFAPRHGFWRKGILFVPPAGQTPSFEGRRPKRGGGGYVVERAANWRITSGESYARYSLRVRR